MDQERDFDLILQGSTGFTGHLAAEELALHAPDSLRWAVAGRDSSRVRALAQRFGVPAIVADGLDKHAVAHLAQRTRVVLSCAGPFSVFGTPLVEACVEHGTHYADLTGELPWIGELVVAHHQRCVEQGTTLIPASGFDSVPADLAVHAMRQQLDQDAPLHGFFTIRGGLNGGTLHSGIALAEQDRLPTSNSSARSTPAVFKVPLLKRWATPFLMAAVNESVVARSDRLLSKKHGGDVSETKRKRSLHTPYEEHMLVRGRLRAMQMKWLLQASTGMLRSAFGRKLLRRFGPKPGEGPSESSIRNGFARFIVVAGDLEKPLAMRRWDWDGDPSNRITVRCLVQTGLALVAGEATSGGVLTPASALGDTLLQRLVDVGAVKEKPCP
ncbi:MAG: saccharopine dehydrogenase NADP-binding domain-containing protein [Planctomycetota bacterium]|jgi:short subunit dehydrogenase-like uncharacterized protein|nr:saccharopine dehydrogenase NADP-binding domain-containing protein [Planctomycetota bacterium]